MISSRVFCWEEIVSLQSGIKRAKFDETITGSVNIQPTSPHAAHSGPRTVAQSGKLSVAGEVVVFL
jgi:hypothetical protein